uniref:S adenosylmethionine mitochondrial carrier n=1 Tax=Echinococcus canadensis TaxID=519352 RepID=A0A915EXP3_9CEST
MSTAFFANRDHLASLLSGATAGFCVDMAVYPIDTIKTRLQSAAHVVKPIGGRMCLFAGLPAVILGSAPGAALFFISYETVKHASLTSGVPLWMASMLSACTGDAGWWGLYRGYWSQVSRGLPFCLIQYPIWELLKRGMEHYNRRQTLDASSFDLNVGEECFPSSTESTSLSKKQFAVCGAIAGAIGGSSTTPMDVAKTRIMLAEKGTPLASGSVTVALRTIYQEGGISGLFAGLVPRVYIKAFGGAVFLGLYDISKRMWLANLPTNLWSVDRAVQFCAGGTAGLLVDVILYPVDTLKTRLQSSSGRIFTPCGRLRLFAGLPTVLLGSGPSSAVFFYAYEVSKDVSIQSSAPMWVASMIGTTIAEITSMVLWVPCENVKQSAQSRPLDSLRSIFKSYVQHEGWLGLYRGYVSTVVRDLPCALIQFPIWEALKSFFAWRNQCPEERCPFRDAFSPPSPSNLTGFQFAMCGFLSGAVAGSVTTPLDVAKTRIMLAKVSFIFFWFAGLMPRMGLLSIGGGIYLGLYDITKSYWNSILGPSTEAKPRP